MAQIFYAPEIETKLMLPEEEAKHCLQVLRKKMNDQVLVINGKGSFFEVKLLSENPKQCSVQIMKKYADTHTRPYYLHIAIAPTKNIERIEWFLEKCTEIGIDEISFLQCKHSERKEVKTERLEKICIQAIKQSQKAFLPKINPIIPFSKFLEQNLAEYTERWIAHVHTKQPIVFQQIVQAKGKICVLIGPEGDFENSEVTKALEKGFQAVSLGNSVLRTETAGIFVCCSLAVKAAL
jgi:16S rRNA (uracil1498-N3)-methyltransferase